MVSPDLAKTAPSQPCCAPDQPARICDATSSPAAESARSRAEESLFSGACHAQPDGPKPGPEIPRCDKGAPESRFQTGLVFPYPSARTCPFVDRPSRNGFRLPGKEPTFTLGFYAIELGRENSFTLTRTGSEETIAAVLGAKK
jgi:hypothetical protein